MSSIETRRNPGSGTISHRVRFRYQGRNKAVPFDTAEQAQAWRTVLDTMGPDVALGLLVDPDPTAGATVADLIAHHIDHLTGVEEGTVTRYRRLHRDHLEPHFSHVLAADLTRDDVATWVNTARLKNGRQPAPKTLRNWHSLLSDALSSAVRDGRLPANVAKGVRLPSRDALADDDMVLLTRPEVDLILAALTEQWRALVLTLVLTGVRWGEATALTVGALDPATRSARIHTAWKQSGKTGGPKSRRSRRTVAVPEAVFVALEPHVTGKAPGELVFLSPRGRRVRSGNFWNGPWSRAIAQVAPVIGKEPRVHDLRHTFASWAIQAGIPLPVIQRQLGHESITTTVDTYGHLARSDFDPLLSLGTGLTTPHVPPAIEAAPASADGPGPGLTPA